MVKVGSAVAAGVGAALARALGREHGFSFAGRVVLITGGSRGLGLVLARELADEGARLVIVARNEGQLAEAKRDLLEHGADVLTIPCDVRNRDQAQGAVERTVTHYGRIDVLVNNAGIIQVGPVENMTLDDFAEAIDVDVWAPLYTMLAAVPHMRRQGGGRIVNIASIGGLVAVPHLVPYCTSKFALVGLSDGMRAELARDNIRVTTICPGLMRTGSHLNALFKGQHAWEFTLFSLVAALPLASIDARRAARQIVAACRRGDPALTITIQARLLAVSNALFPGLVGRAMALTARLLPGPPTGEEGDRARTGWQSRTRLSPSLLTRLADRAATRNNEGLTGGR